MKTIQERLQYAKEMRDYCAKVRGEMSDKTGVYATLVRGYEADVAALERQFAAEQAKVKGIEVGAIVANCFGRGVVEATEEGVFAAIVRNTDGLGRFTADALTAIFPANHPVAQSLAARKDGEFYEGDVVAVDVQHPVNWSESMRRDTYTLISNMSHFRLYNENGPTGFAIGPYHIPKTRLVTPRELRTYIGNANGGEWSKWFAGNVGEAQASAEVSWIPQKGEIIVGYDRDGDAGIAHGQAYRVKYMVGTTHAVLEGVAEYSVNIRNLRPWTPQVGDEVAVLVKHGFAGASLELETKYRVEDIGDTMFGIRDGNGRYFAVAKTDVIPWSLRPVAQESMLDPADFEYPLVNAPEQPSFQSRVASIILSLLNSQTAKGVATYGMTLDQNDEYDELRGLLEELVDAMQYTVRAIERRDARDAVVRGVIEMLDKVDTFTPYDVAKALDSAVIRLRSTLTVTDAKEVVA